MHQNIILWSNGVDRVRSLRKIPTRHRGTNFCTSLAYFAPSFVTQPNAPQCKQIVQNAQNISSGSTGTDRVRSLRKIPTRLRGTNFCTSSACSALSFVRQPNGPKCTQIVRNTPNFFVYGPMGWIGCVRCEKFRRDFVARTFALVWPVLHRVPYGNRTVPNAPK